MAENITDETLDELAFNLFKIFAQYEALLKRNGYFISSSDCKRIFTRLNTFAIEKIKDDFIEKLADKAYAAKYILDNPPWVKGVG